MAMSAASSSASVAALLPGLARGGRPLIPSRLLLLPLLLLPLLLAAAAGPIDRRPVVSSHSPTSAGAFAAAAGPIDRRAVVSRHSPTFAAATGALLNASDVATLGNGAFGFNADASGLQSFNGSYASVFDLNTLSDWAFHTSPYSADDPTFALRTYNFSYLTAHTDGAGGTRDVPYLTVSNVSADVVGWLHDNPHRLSLAQISLRLSSPTPSGGPTSPVPVESAADLTRFLDIYAGELQSNMSLSSGCSSPQSPSAPGSGGCGVSVLTSVHPVIDLVSTRITTTAAAAAPAGAAAAAGAAAPAGAAAAVLIPLSVRVAFGYGSVGAPGAATWSSATDALHTTTVLSIATDPATGGGSLSLLRVLDGDRYEVFCAFAPSAPGGASWAVVRAGPHVFDIVPSPPSSSPSSSSSSSSSTLEVSCLFAPVALAYPIGSWMPWMQARIAATAGAIAAFPPASAPGSPFPMYAATSEAAAQMWSSFWAEGAFVDLYSNSNGDAQALELERRVVLSLYLTRANSAGSMPPQETGLLCNSWQGKSHMEMHYWHQAHWATWGRADLLHRSDGLFVDMLPNATSYASFQGYAGARWPKMIAPFANRSAVGGGIDVPWLGLDFAPFPFNNGDYDGVPGLLVADIGSPVGPLLVWEQSHTVWLADAQRKAANATGGSAAALEVVAFQAPLVEATAEFIASYLYLNETDDGEGTGRPGGAFWIGPPVLGGEETGTFSEIYGPNFEIVQLALALDLANEWRALQGLPANDAWSNVSSRMMRLFVDPASLPSAPTYSFNRKCACALNQPAPSQCVPGRWNLTQCPLAQSHPMMVGLHGMVNGRHMGDRYGVDVVTANNTVAGVLQSWDWFSGWGWDFGLIALAQARAGGWTPEAVAVGTLLKEEVKNTYLPNGYNFQEAGLPAYLPGNGALLQAVSALAAGMEGELGGPPVPPVGFPAAWGAVVEGFPIPFP